MRRRSRERLGLAAALLLIAAIPAVIFAFTVADERGRCADWEETVSAFHEQRDAEYRARLGEYEAAVERWERENPEGSLGRTLEENKPRPPVSTATSPTGYPSAPLEGCRTLEAVLAGP